MASFHQQQQQPEPSGSFSEENAPQVVVRAGKHYVCSSCGTLVEIPAEVVGQLVLAAAPSPQEEASPPTPPQAPSTVIAAPSPQPPRPKRPSKPQRPSFVGETIDGLRVPSANELDRALAWVSFHLRVLDRQGSEIKRLQKAIEDRNPPVQQASDRRAQAEPAQQDASSEPQPSQNHTDQQERGPP
ncbi:hypothetical protein [Bremerella sp.]|uniref:hypothetical protein n=1 Tax=Bremerella sp. TaxID=2795602 RepID=UPI00391CA0FD